MCQGTSFFRVLAEQKNNTIEKERRQYMQYGGRDSKTMKGKLLTGVGLLLIAAALLLTVYNSGSSSFVKSNLTLSLPLSKYCLRKGCAVASRYD